LPQLGDAFAQACWWTYTDHFDDITSIIQSAKKDDIIVIYSAGDIDFKLRNYLAK
jgi:UDP-N-acetylmuramate-alanine ligase